MLFNFKFCSDTIGQKTVERVFIEDCVIDTSLNMKYVAEKLELWKTEQLVLSKKERNPRKDTSDSSCVTPCYKQNHPVRN